MRHHLLVLLGISILACNTSDRPAATAAGTTAPTATPANAATGAVDTITTSSGDLKITPINHATMMLEWGGKVILVDPTPQAQPDKVPRADMILITDIHQDHMSAPSVTALKKDSTVIVVPPSVEQNLGM